MTVPFLKTPTLIQVCSVAFLALGFFLYVFSDAISFAFVFIFLGFMCMMKEFAFDDIFGNHQTTTALVLDTIKKSNLNTSDLKNGFEKLTIGEDKWYVRLLDYQDEMIPVFVDPKYSAETIDLINKEVFDQYIVFTDSLLKKTEIEFNGPEYRMLNMGIPKIDAIYPEKTNKSVNSLSYNLVFRDSSSKKKIYQCKYSDQRFIAVESLA